LINYAYIPAATMGILLTASRGALLATLPAWLFVLGTFPRLNLFLRFLIVTILISVLFIAPLLIPESSFERLSTLGASISQGDLGNRMDVWRGGILVFSEHPLFGIGNGAFPTTVPAREVAHNIFLSILTEVGLVGFGLFMLILVTTGYQALRQPKWDARFWLALLLVWVIGAAGLTWEQRKVTWLFLNLTVVSAGLSVRRDEPEIVSPGFTGYPSSPRLGVGGHL
jgi:O-antigen ligase